MSVLDIKGALAKCLATENLVVNHDSAARTATFNSNTRVLTLPVLNINSQHVYDMFVGHEVGHALWTPRDWAENVPAHVPHDYVNVVEDVRIEKAIQNKFPGLRVDFARGYDELHNRDFFEVDGKDIAAMPLPDRINLHFKLGARAVIPFTEEEMVYVRAIDEADTFDKVVLVSTLLADYMGTQPNLQDNQEHEAENAKQDDNAPDVDQEETEGKAQPQEQNDAPQPAQQDKVQTQRSLDKNMGKLMPESYYGNTVDYVVVPEEIKTNNIMPLCFVRSDMSTAIMDASLGMREHLDAAFNEFMKSIKRDVNFMVQQFEMRKAADAYARTQVHKTGVLDTNNLHNYKLTDDLFLRHTVTPTGKSHGLVMLVDWSGSMADVCLSTVKQIIVLAQFCRKVAIDFDVYTFTCRGYGLPYDTPVTDYDNGEIITNGAQVVHVLSSSEKRRILDTDIRHLFYNGYAITYTGVQSTYLHMGGTPLNNVLFQVPELIKRHKARTSAQKVSFVCLTDGESSPLHYVDRNGERGYINCTNMMRDTLLRDGHHTYKIDVKNQNETAGIVSYLKQVLPGVTFTNIYLGGPKACSNYAYSYYGQSINKDEFRREGSTLMSNPRGWDIIPLINPRNFGDSPEDIAVDAGASKGAIRQALKKYLRSKCASKTVLTSLVCQFA